MVPLCTRIIFILSLCALTTGNVFAQASGQMMDGHTTPSFPAPNQPFSITLESSFTDLNRALITWRRDGKQVAQGVGLKTFSASAGKAGTEIRLSASAETKDLGRLEKSFVLRPAGLELLWQADTYKPAFYKGKALPSPESRVTLIAIPEFINPQGKRVDPSNIVFTWKRNGRVLESQSGAGKNIFLLNTSQLEEDMPSISVEAKSLDGAVVAQAEASIPLVSPNIVFYTSNELTGTMLNRALTKDTLLESAEIGLVASPYFIGSQLPNDASISFEWRLNGSPLSEQKGSYISLRKPEGEGLSVLSLYVEKIGSLFNNARNSLELRYGQ